MTDDQILLLLPQLLSLPIVNEDNYYPTIARHWIEPFEYIKLGKNATIPKNFDQNVIKIQIARLIRIAKLGDDEARSRALLRLDLLIDTQALDEAKKKEFAEVLWDRIDPNTNLPDQTPFLNSAFIKLPEIEDSDAEGKFRDYLSATPIPRIIVRKYAPDGKQIGVTTHVPNNLPNYLSEWESASPPRTCLNTCKDGKYINWTPEERSALLLKVEEVWDELKDLLGDSGKNLEAHRLDSLHSQFSGLVRLLNAVILPNIHQLRRDEIEKLKLRLLPEMEELGVNVLSAYPFVLLVDSSYYERVTALLREGIISPNPSKVHDALIGIYHWICCSRNENCLPPLEDLLNELVHMISTRRQPELDMALNIAAAIVEGCPDTFSQKQLQELYIGLEYLLIETDLLHEHGSNTRWDQPVSIPLNEKPDIRRYSAVLAHALHKYCTAHSNDMPTVLDKWKEICKSDPLPEVRKAWKI
jgi:hypothetical protein